MPVLKPFTATVALVAAVMLAPVAATHAAVQRLVTTGDTVDGRILTTISDRPDINDSGQIVYVGGFTDGRALFINHDEIVSPGDTLGSAVFDTPYGSTPVINNAGTVAFGFRDSASTTYLATQNDLVFDFADQVEGHTMTSIGAAAINDNGLIAFASSYFESPPSTNVSVVTTPDTILFRTGSTIEGVTITSTTGLLTRHSLNNDGDMAMVGLDASGERYLMTQDTFLGREGDVIGGQTIRYFNSVLAFNDHGNVLFSAAVGSENGARLLTLDRLVAAPGQTIDGQTILNFSNTLYMDINNAGQVAWAANLAGGGEGIFLDDKLLVKTGDIIDGLTIASLTNPTLNNHGLVVAHASYTNGSEGLIVIPEPSALALLTLTGAVTLTRRRQRRTP